MDPTVSLTQGPSPIQEPIKRVPVDQDSRIVGIQLSPDGDFSPHLRVMKFKADSYASRLSSPKLTAADIRIFHRNIYTPAMKYSLPAIAVDEELFAPVQSKILAAILNGLGISRTIPTPIRHGPTAMGGLDLLDLRTEAGISAIKLLRDSIFAKSETGQNDSYQPVLQPDRIWSGRTSSRNTLFVHLVLDSDVADLNPTISISTQPSNPPD